MFRVIIICDNEQNSVARDFINRIPKTGLFAYYFDPEVIGRKRKGYNSALDYVRKNCINTVLCSISFLDVAVKLMWQSETVNRLILLNGEDPFCPEHNEKRVQELLWNNIANSGEGIIEQSGWVSSFTGMPFSPKEMEEYANDVILKIGGMLDKNSRVLEIGVASGITLFSIAPLVSEYVGIDLSPITIEKTEQEVNGRRLSNCKFFVMDASEIDQLDLGEFDCVIINSVAQYFPGYNYFLDILRKSVALLGCKGFIYLGDVLLFDLITRFDRELDSFGGGGEKPKRFVVPFKANKRDFCTDSGG